MSWVSSLHNSNSIYYSHEPCTINSEEAQASSIKDCECEVAIITAQKHALTMKKPDEMQVLTCFETIFEYTSHISFIAIDARSTYSRITTAF